MQPPYQQCLMKQESRTRYHPAMRPVCMANVRRKVVIVEWWWITVSRSIWALNFAAYLFQAVQDPEFDQRWHRICGGETVRVYDLRVCMHFILTHTSSSRRQATMQGLRLWWKMAKIKRVLGLSVRVRWSCYALNCYVYLLTTEAFTYTLRIKGKSNRWWRRVWVAGSRAYWSVMVVQSHCALNVCRR